MRIGKDSVVQLHYDLLGPDGTALESTRNGEPLSILVGYRNVVYGLERALEGKAEGETLEVTVAPEEGYGPRREGWTERFSKKHFARPKSLRPGAQTVVRTSNGMRRVTVLKVGGKVADVDMNHPLAGQTLHYKVEVVSVREAAAEEIAHRHVHGPGGHHH